MSNNQKTRVQFAYDKNDQIATLNRKLSEKQKSLDGVISHYRKYEKKERNENEKLKEENAKLKEENAKLKKESAKLKEENKDFKKRKKHYLTTLNSMYGKNMIE